MREVSFGDSVTVILPEALYHSIWDGVEADISPLKYSKVIMKLEEVLKGEFFTEYIKKGVFRSLSLVHFDREKVSLNPHKH